MILRISATAVLLAAFALPAVAEGDAVAGEKEFNKCKSCHSLTDAAGNDVVKGGKTGPNLWGVVGRPVAGVADFKYGEGMIAAGAAGLVWDEAALAEYTKDPGAWVKKATGDDAAKSKMTFKLAKGNEDLVAYLATMK
jgi:cytochrome c